MIKTAINCCKKKRKRAAKKNLAEAPSSNLINKVIMEKRKKLSVQVEDGAYHVDVEEYEYKKSTFRHKWVYFATLALILVVVYFQFHSHNSDISVKKNADFVEQSITRNSNSTGIHIKSSYATKTTVLNQIPPPPAVPTVAASSTVKLADNTKALNLRSESIVENSHVGDLSEEELQSKVNAQIATVRKMKFEQHIVMEKNEDAKKEILVLQDLVRKLIYKQYGTGPLRVEMKLLFPQSMSQPTMPQEQTIVIDLAPVTLVPYSVYFFLEMVKHWKSGAFSRNAGHVLQATANLDQQGGGGGRGLAFQEYHPDFPHKQYTLGYAGRPGGPAFYISTVNNVQNHGPGSQGSSTEADGCFGKVQAQSIDVVKRMQTQPGANKPMGFVNNPANHIKIVSLKVVH